MSDATCRVCGCTDDHACNPPCAWFDPTLCTTCALAAEALRGWLTAAASPSLAKLMEEAGAGTDPRVIDTSDADLVRMIGAMLRERTAFITEHAAGIGVRVQIEGRWQNRYLTELPAADALREGFRLLLRAEQPHRRVEPEPATQTTQ